MFTAALSYLVFSQDSINQSSYCIVTYLPTYLCTCLSITLDDEVINILLRVKEAGSRNSNCIFLTSNMHTYLFKKDAYLKEVLLHT